MLGHPALAVIPKTSTIASHLPRALGAAFAIDRARKIGCPSPWPADAVVVCSFGDASANHSTAAGAINAAIQIGFRRLPLPLLLVCEDNGIGISVPTPEGWVAHAYGQRPGLRYFAADGCDLADAVATAARAAEWVRAHRRPALLHLRTVRLMGHAGSDVETAYRRGEDIAADLGCDPLLGTARLLVDAGILTPAQVLARYEDTREAVLEIALAYLHNAEDQLHGEAATLQFFSNGQYRNPMVVRVAGFGYQRGFGGHFHNDDAVGVLRDIPGIVIASPGRPDDAAAMLRTCVAAAEVHGAVCVFLEPIARYHTRDLHTDGDNGWLAPYPTAHVPVGRARSYGDGTDLCLVSWANGLYLSLRVAARLAARGIRCRVVDLRWLAPLPIEDVLQEANTCGRVLVVDETRRSGGVSEGVLAGLVDAGFTGRMARVTSKDSFIPLGDAALHILVSEDEIEAAARKLVDAGPRSDRRRSASHRHRS